MPKQPSLYVTALREARKRRLDFDRAFKLLMRADKSGDARATYALATWYLHGKHVAQNVRKATTLLRRAAAKDVPDALFDLAVSHEKGIGVSKDQRKAAELYLRCALAGGAGAHFEVGRCYFHGIGFQKDRSVARIWLRVARRARKKTKTSRRAT
jgi:TPR repeat protein